MRLSPQVWIKSNKELEYTFSRKTKLNLYLKKKKTNDTAAHSSKSKLALCSKCALFSCAIGKGNQIVMKQQRLHSNTTPTILVSATENSPASLDTELKGTGDQRMFYFLVFYYGEEFPWTFS